MGSNGSEKMKMEQKESMEPLEKLSSDELASPFRPSNDPTKAVLPLYTGRRPRVFRTFASG